MFYNVNYELKGNIGINVSADSEEEAMNKAKNILEGFSNELIGQTLNNISVMGCLPLNAKYVGKII